MNDPSKATLEQQEIHLLTKYFDPDDIEFKADAALIRIYLHLHGFELTERYLQRRNNKDVRRLLHWFRGYLRNLIGVYEKGEELQKEDDPTESFDTRNNKRHAKLVKYAQHFSFNGHMNYTDSWRDVARGEFLSKNFGLLAAIDKMMPEEDLDLLLKFKKDPSVPMPRFIVYNERGYSNKCSNCCEEIYLETNGHEVRIAGTCKHPFGYPPWSVEVDFPTGRLALNDDLRPWFREAWEVIEEQESDPEHWKKFDINQNIGIHNTAQVYADYGYMTGFIGNSCPNVYQDPNNPGRLIIGTARVLDKKTGKEADSICGFKHVGGITTDLWWYSIADMVHIENTTPLVRTFDRETHKMTLKPEPSLFEQERCLFQLEVPPGRYRAYNLYHLLQAYELDYDPDIDCLFVYIERVGDCKRKEKI